MMSPPVPAGFHDAGQRYRFVVNAYLKGSSDV
jgi:hypothetical protein